MQNYQIGGFLLAENLEPVEPMYLYLGVSRAIGAPTAKLYEALKNDLKESYGVETIEIKLSRLFSEYTEGPLAEQSFDRYVQLMDLGDWMRSLDTTAIAQLGIRQIAVEKNRIERECESKQKDVRIAFFIDSLMHKAEAQLFREVYGDDFFPSGPLLFSRHS
ncbi:hypothetical protein CH254_04780 [Rhodococcus sp. 06-412-2C]|uniref:hypothetical protein n=1 Tax=unclassified Rhodococcus (in: high G+C Gram-positive bacteria) TaxID=192944 RepID=UPI000B9A72D4|nr:MULTISPECIES: hypothetical protein [unclassified Rhodococcus (in: high G+C Gram-positive bacteria)]OZC91796.1 hypothetical protein CH254_04780 [Rhodococcus sp. 06-412-2C]OZC92365.1 hypothetical protein CH279_26060 [Rhodococcus sp. 06-412-2B]